MQNKNTDSKTTPDILKERYLKDYEGFVKGLLLLVMGEMDEEKLDFLYEELAYTEFPLLNDDFYELASIYDREKGMCDELRA